MGRIGKSIGAAGQQSGKLAGKKRVAGLAVVLLREQNAGQGSICPRQEGVATRPRLETRGLRERPGTAIEAGADLPPVRGVDKPDRHRSDAAWRQEHRMHKLRFHKYFTPATTLFRGVSTVTASSSRGGS